MRGPGRGHEGLNIPDVQRAVAREGGRLPARPALARTAASAVTLGSGGAAGSEGPVAVLGAALASFLGSAFRFDPARTKVLVAAGAAAGISAAFNAPLAGAFFALEEILGSLAVGAFPSVVVASVVAAVVSHTFLGNNPAFPVPEEYGYALQREVLIFYPFLGVVAGLVAVLFVRVYFAHGEARQGDRRSTLGGRVPRGSAGRHPGAPLQGAAGGPRPPGRAPRGLRAHVLECAGAARAGQHTRHLDHPHLRRVGRRLHPFAVRRRGCGRLLRRGARRALSRARSAPRGVRTGGHGRGGRRRHLRADHRHAAGVRDDQRLQHRPAAHADHGDRQPGGAAAGAGLALQRVAPPARRAAPARRRSRRARRTPRGRRLRPGAARRGGDRAPGPAAGAPGARRLHRSPRGGRAPAARGHHPARGARPTRQRAPRTDRGPGGVAGGDRGGDGDVRETPCWTRSGAWACGALLPFRWWIAPPAICSAW